MIHGQASTRPRQSQRASESNVSRNVRPSDSTSHTVEAAKPSMMTMPMNRAMRLRERVVDRIHARMSAAAAAGRMMKPMARQTSTAMPVLRSRLPAVHGTADPSSDRMSRCAEPLGGAPSRVPRPLGAPWPAAAVPGPAAVGTTRPEASGGANSVVGDDDTGSSGNSNGSCGSCSRDRGPVSIDGLSKGSRGSRGACSAGASDSRAGPGTAGGRISSGWTTTPLTSTPGSWAGSVSGSAFGCANAAGASRGAPSSVRVSKMRCPAMPAILRARDTAGPGRPRRPSARGGVWGLLLSIILKMSRAPARAPGGHRAWRPGRKMR